MKWEKVALGEVTESCLGKMLDQEKNKGEYQPYLANLNVRWGSFDLDDLPEMRFEEHEQERYGLKYGDLIICEGGEPGRCAIWKDQIPNMKIQKALHRVRVNSEMDYRYLFYWFLLAGKNNALDQYFTGATIKHMPGQKLKQVIIDKPPFEVQQRIADILSAYDDLIENNQKQIKLLEEAAQRLYKEWFVDLRFPGYENVPVVDGVPQGWEKKSIEECLAFHGNGGWGKEITTGKNIYPGKVIRGTDINDIKNGHFGDIPTRYHSDNDIKSRTLKQDDLVFELSNGNINNIGRCLFVDDLILKNCGTNTICASFCKVLRPLDKPHALVLYFEIQDMQTSGRMLPLKKHGANGINNFDFEGFLHHELLIPNDTDMIESLKTIMRKISIIQGKITLLIEVRDRLLPKLMSGELEV